jgi:hypothetical protein
MIGATGIRDWAVRFVSRKRRKTTQPEGAASPLIAQPSFQANPPVEIAVVEKVQNSQESRGDFALSAD